MPLNITICIKCKYYKNTDSNNIWYNQICLHPDVEFPKGIDPVTGKIVFWTKNSLGMTYENDHPHPYCRDINDGHCKFFKEQS